MVNEHLSASDLARHLQTWLTKLKDAKREFSEIKEESAFAQMAAEILGENDSAIRVFMEDLLLSACHEAEVLPSIVYEYTWVSAVARERDLSKSFPTEFYIDVERLLSGYVWSGYVKDGIVRYPLTMQRNRPGKRKVRNLESKATSPSKMLDALYDFGSNKYNVGRAIEGLIAFIEQRYQICILDLEADYIKRKALQRKQTCSPF